jgi:hypothetical protein
MPLLVGSRRALLGGVRSLVVFASDLFTDANGTTLQSHTPTGGGTWTKHSASTADALIESNRVKGATTSTTQLYTHSATPPAADYDVACDVLLISATTTNGAGPAGRMDAAANTCYFARYNSNTGGWELFKLVAGVATQLGSTVTQSLTLAQRYRATLSLRGTTISLAVDGVTIISVTDSAISAAGAVGLRINGLTAASTGVQLDTWQAAA